MNDLNYISLGVGTPMVFQHGLTANTQQTQSLLQGMNGLHLISLDCPGHGTSPLPPEYAASFNNYADDVIRMLDHLNISEAIFGGISMGSGISQNIALRYPERVKALILARPAWLNEANPENLKILLTAAKYREETGGEQLFRQHTDFKSIRLPAVAESILGIFDVNQQPALPKVIRHMVGDRPFDSMDQLMQIKAPCLVLGNEDDPLHPFEMAVKIHQSISGSVLRKLTSRYIDNDLHSTQVRNSINHFMKEHKLYL